MAVIVRDGFFEIGVVDPGHALGNTGGGGPTNGLLQEDGASFILAENSDYLVQE